MSTLPIRLLNIADIDEQHLALASIITELELANERDAPADELTAVISRLIGAAEVHFDHEEDVMAKNEYPLLEHHHHCHYQLITFLRRIAEEVSAEQLRVDKELITSLWAWETEHIDTADQEYAEFVKKQKMDNSDAR